MENAHRLQHYGHWDRLMGLLKISVSNILPLPTDQYLALVLGSGLSELCLAGTERLRAGLTF